jgi:arsenite/tail-anchored protein-transporting ATPase
VSRFLELGLPGVDELVGLIELRRLVRAAPGDEVVVDTAPTAHTLRLLAMPGELRRFASVLDRLEERHRTVATALGGAWQPDAADALIAEIETEGRELEALLRDPERTAFFWVLLPEILSVEETRDGVRALEEAGIPVPELIVNRMTPPHPGCARCAARRRAEREAVKALREALPKHPVRFVPALAREPRGLAGLRRVGRLLGAPPAPPGVKTPGYQKKIVPKGTTPPPAPFRGRLFHGSQGFQSLAGPAPWLADLIPETARLLFFVGKGGVGKTTCAAAAALLLAEARPGRRLLLLSADPAHSLADVLDVPLGDDPRLVPGAAGLRARELDSFRTFAAWRDEHLAGVEELQGLLDLAPPGLDELSAVSALIDALEEEDLVIVDTAPTGHALRLLEAPGLLQGWVKELLALLLEYREAVRLGRLAEELVAMSRHLRRLAEALHDPALTRFFAVTRNAELPRRETVRLWLELERLELDASAALVDAVNEEDAAREEAEIRKLRRDLDRAGRSRCAIISAPAVFPPPRGVATLRDWGRTWTLWE